MLMKHVLPGGTIGFRSISKTEAMGLSTNAFSSMPLISVT